MLADVFQFGGLLRLGVEQGLDPPPIGKRPIVVLFGPDRRLLDDQSFAIRIELVGQGVGDWGLGTGDWGLGTGAGDEGLRRRSTHIGRGTNAAMCAAVSERSCLHRLIRATHPTVYWPVSCL